MDSNTIQLTTEDSVLMQENLDKATKKNKFKFKWQIQWGLKQFTVIACLSVLCVRLLSVYNIASGRMVEKHFGLTGMETSWLVSVDNIASIVAVAVFGYIGGKFNRARFLAIMSISLGISYLLISLPYFISLRYNDIMRIKPGDLSEKLYSNQTKSEGMKLPDIICLKSSPQNTTSNPQNRSTFSQEYQQNGHLSDVYSSKMFYILWFGRLLIGVFHRTHLNLPFIYISENCDINRAVFYGGWVSLFSFIGVSLGKILAGVFNQLPLHLTSSVIKPGDPRFLGAWWLGYVIFGGLLILTSVPLFTFPSKLYKKTSKPEDQVAVEKSPSLKITIRDIVVSVRTVLSTPAFILYSLTLSFTTGGMMTANQNGFRYTEVHFRLPIYYVSYLLGIVGAIGGLTGGLFGGPFLGRFQLSRRRLAVFLLLLGIAGVLTNASHWLLGCPQLEFKNIQFTKDKGPVFDSNCSSSCQCDFAASQPVCGTNGVDYFSPCHAGCTTRNGTKQTSLFTDCSCVPDGTTTAGSCPMDCPYLIPFLVLTAALLFLFAAGNTPFNIITLKLLPEELGSLSLGIQACFTNLLGHIPFPLISGFFIDKSCLIWQTTSDAVGSCLLYDVTRLRHSILGVSMTSYALALVFAIIVLKFVPPEKIKKEAITTNIGLSKIGRI